VEELMPRKHLTISDVAKHLGLAKSTVQYWTSMGLLKPEDVGPNGYRYYDTLSLRRASEIKRLREEERLTIKEIKERLG
jgi:DNA-binding transcriptional MerR regulator